MRKKICIALMAAFTVLLGVSSYFIIDHYREAEHQEQLYDSLVQLVEAEQRFGRLDLRGGYEHQLSRYADG